MDGERKVEGGRVAEYRGYGIHQDPDKAKYSLIDVGGKVVHETSNLREAISIIDHAKEIMEDVMLYGLHTYRSWIVDWSFSRGYWIQGREDLLERGRGENITPLLVAVVLRGLPQPADEAPPQAW